LLQPLQLHQYFCLLWPQFQENKLN
jgi:hypothetical protein